MGYSYRDAGVDIDAGNRSVELIKPAVARTARPGVIGGLGGFGGLFALDVQKYSDPVLVSGTDGVGTKLKLAFQADRHDTIGQDAVAMCVNDVLVQGAEPLFFLDYLAVGKLKPERVAAIVQGVAAGCELAGCALIGGETAEMPGFYPENEYDIAGFAVGAANRADLIDGSGIKDGNVLIGLKSSGVHSNGFSLVRKIIEPYEPDTVFPELGESLVNVLLRPTRIYVKTILPLLPVKKIHGMVHITGGGFTDNIPRVLPAGLGVEIKLGSWIVPPVFNLLQRLGQVADSEMYRTFNMGIGFILIVQSHDEAWILDQLKAAGEEATKIGQVIKGQGVKFS